MDKRARVIEAELQAQQERLLKIAKNLREIIALEKEIPEDLRQHWSKDTYLGLARSLLTAHEMDADAYIAGREALDNLFEVEVERINASEEVTDILRQWADSAPSQAS